MKLAQQLEHWLDEESEIALQRVTAGESLKTEEVIILTLKAQTDHIALLREDMNKRFEQVDKRLEMIQEQMDKRFEVMQEQMDKRFEVMQEQMDKHFERVDKRFEVMQEQMDKRFEMAQEQMDKHFERVDKRLEVTQEQMDKRFESLENRMYDFMRWSISTTVVIGGLVVAAIKLI